MARSRLAVGVEVRVVIWTRFIGELVTFATVDPHSTIAVAHLASVFVGQPGRSSQKEPPCFSETVAHTNSHCVAARS